MLLPLMLAVMVSATANTEAPLERALRVWEPKSQAQATAIASTAPELCYSGRKFGLKSHTLAMKGAIYAQRYGPNNGYPKARIIACREERAAMEQTLIATMRDEILGPELHGALYNTKDDGIILPNGSAILYRGLDRPERIQGMRYGLAVCDQAEQLSEDQFTILDMGCTQVGMPWTQTALAFNPEGPGHWAYLRYHPDEGDGPRMRDGKHFADVVHVQIDDGLDLLTPQQLDKLNRPTGVHRDRLRFGKWVAFEGLVYELWDSGIHIIDPPASWAAWDGLPPPSWPRWRGVDFGYNPDPYAIGWLTQSPEGVWYLYRQEYRLKLTIDVQTARIRQFENQERAWLKAAAKRQDIADGHGSRFGPCWTEARDYLGESSDPDHTAGLDITGISDHEAQHRAMYALAGLPSRRANKDIRSGIDTLRNLLDPEQPGGPRFFVIRGSLLERDRRLEDAQRPTCFEEEIGRYLWKTSKGPSGSRAMRDMPADMNNHMLDAVRYVVHTAESRPTHFVASGDDEAEGAVA